MKRDIFPKARRLLRGGGTTRSIVAYKRTVEKQPGGDIEPKVRRLLRGGDIEPEVRREGQNRRRSRAEEPVYRGSIQVSMRNFMVSAVQCRGSDQGSMRHCMVQVLQEPNEESDKQGSEQRDEQSNEQGHQQRVDEEEVDWGSTSDMDMWI